jgi:hypothetical protein
MHSRESKEDPTSKDPKFHLTTNTHSSETLIQHDDNNNNNNPWKATPLIESSFPVTDKPNANEMTNQTKETSIYAKLSIPQAQE